MRMFTADILEAAIIYTTHVCYIHQAYTFKYLKDKSNFKYSIAIYVSFQVALSQSNSNQKNPKKPNQTHKPK